LATVIKENYLKALYILDQKDTEISVSDLGKLLKVSKPTVNDMIKKLEKRGWLNYKKYKPISFTTKGRKAAALIIRKHRLTEMFLVKIMGLGWEEVHEIAEQIEHIKSDRFFDRMDEILGFPNEDPHGSPIPNKQGKVKEPNYLPLTECEENTSVTLKGLNNSSKELLIYLNNKEIQLGTKLRINKKEPFDQSINLSYGNHREVDISHTVAKSLLVEKS